MTDTSRHHWSVTRRDMLGGIAGLPMLVAGCHPAKAGPDAPICVVDHGAQGSAGIDDTPAFTRAIAVAVARGRGIRIPEGRYEISRIEIPPGLVSIEGPGWLVARDPDVTAVVHVVGTVTRPVVGLHIGINIDAAQIARCAIFCTGLVGSRITGCRITGLARNDGDGIRVNFPACRDNVIADNEVMLAQVAHATHADGLRGIHVVGETVSPAGGIDRAGQPIAAANSVSGHRVTGNRVTGGTHGIAFFGSRDITVRDNECRGQSARNIIASPSVEQGEIVGNRCLDAGSSGIHLADGTRAITISDNLVSSIRSGLTDDDDAAIQAYVGCRAIRIVGNEVRGDWRYGIAVTLAQDIAIVHNQLVGPFRQASVAIESDYAGLHPPAGAPFARARAMPWPNMLATRNIELVDNDYGTAPVAIGIAQYRDRALDDVTIRGGTFKSADHPLAVYQARAGAIRGLTVADAAIRADARNLLSGLTIAAP